MVLYIFSPAAMTVGKIRFSLQDVIGYGSHGTVVYRLVYLQSVVVHVYCTIHTSSTVESLINDQLR